MKTKTHPFIIEQVTHTLGNGHIIHHPPTPENQLGQSSIHTFIDDIMDIVESFHNFKPEEKQMMFRNLNKLFINQEKTIEAEVVTESLAN